MIPKPTVLQSVVKRDAATGRRGNENHEHQQPRQPAHGKTPYAKSSESIDPNDAIGCAGLER
jgi:hypothetical protein